MLVIIEDDLKQVFESHGEISEITIPVDESKRPKGYAFIQFMFPECAVTAMSSLDGSDFLGRIMHIIPAQAKQENSDDKKKMESTSYKQKKEDERIKTANDDASWNALFMRSDTIVDALSHKLNISKVCCMLVIIPHTK